MDYVKEINAVGYKLVCLYFFGERDIDWQEEVESTIATLHRLAQVALAACGREKISSKEFHEAISAANDILLAFSFIVPYKEISI